MRTALAVLALLLATAACSDGGAGGSPDDDAAWADDLARARAAAFFVPGSAVDHDAARQALAPLVARDDARWDDLVRAAVVELHDPAGDLEAGRALIDRAAAQRPDELSVRWLRGLYAHRDIFTEGAVQRARDDFAFVVAADPSDASARIHLADVLVEQDDPEGAMEQYEAVRSLGLGPNGAFFQTATYKLSQLIYRVRRDPEGRALAKALGAEKEQLEGRGIKVAGDPQLWIGRHGDLLPPAPVRLPPGSPRAPALAGFAEGATLLDGEGATALLITDVDADGRADVLAATPTGARLVLHDGTTLALTDGAATALAAGDLDEGDPLKAGYAPALELALVDDGRLRLHALADQGAVPVDGAPLVEDVRDVAFVDLDHSGALDLVAATGAGLTWIRNDGRREDGSRLLTALTPEVLAVGDVRAVLIDDFDLNQAVDLLAVLPDRLVALGGLWFGEFADVTADWRLDAVTVDARTADGGLVVGDLDRDEWPDLLVATAEGLSAWLGGPAGFGRPLEVALDRPAPRAMRLVDLDADGLLDLVGLDADGGLVAWVGPLLGRSAPLTSQSLGASGAALALGDHDGDHVLDLALGAPGRTTLRPGRRPAGRTLTLALEGHSANPQGIGSIVEVLTRDGTQRHFVTGGELVLGLGERDAVDVLFVRWPDGIHQRAFDLAAGTRVDLAQIPGQIGSCPFLYTWDGTTFAFITDVLGASPLGLPMDEERMVPFDHDEYVKVGGDRLVPRDGVLELVLTEELREVTYLDQVRLHAIDHPADVEIQPDEAFVFPPFPEHHVHTLRDVVPLAHAVDGDGRDVTDVLAAVDSRHAAPSRVRPGRMHGLAEPWRLDMTLAATDAQRDALAAAPRVRLALTGWLFWPDATTNVAASRHDEVAFEPPLLWVPDGSGPDGWRPAGPPIGFITGKTKTMIVDVTDVIDRADPRLRMTSTLELHWDAIRIVLDDDDAPFTDTALPVASSDLAYRGFSRMLLDPSGEYGDLFDWDETMHPRWDQHPGRYTRYGDVTPLLDAVDDLYVIMGAGDGLTLRFDANALPPLPEGWSRDWLVYFDGWAKDRDPHTRACRSVEPLPFHAMSAYPPPAGETFPDTPAHRAWRETWNTREGRRLIPPLHAIDSAQDVRLEGPVFDSAVTVGEGSAGG